MVQNFQQYHKNVATDHCSTVCYLVKGPFCIACERTFSSTSWVLTPELIRRPCALPLDGPWNYRFLKDTGKGRHSVFFTKFLPVFLMKITLHRSTSSPSEFKSTQPLSLGMTHDAGDGAGSTVFVIYYKIEVCGQKKKMHSWNIALLTVNIHGKHVLSLQTFMGCM